MGAKRNAQMKPFINYQFFGVVCGIVQSLLRLKEVCKRRCAGLFRRGPAFRKFFRLPKLFWPELARRLTGLLAPMSGQEERLSIGVLGFGKHICSFCTGGHHVVSGHDHGSI